ncbi:MAG: hypothetical protein OXR73_21010 [Myxococcales bacterium]|nr:hypothetical protein [Myxococcales bacterium]
MRINLDDGIGAVRRLPGLRYLWLCSLATSVAGCLGPNGDPVPKVDAGPIDAGDASTPQAATWEQAFDTSESGALFGVWGSAPDDVFIVGGTDTQAEIYHYDGTGWSPMEAPDVAALIWLTGFGPNDVYAVGLGGAVVHYDGRRWDVLDSGVEDDLWGIFGFDDSELWIVGGDPADPDAAPVLLRYDGATFERVAVDPGENSRNARALFKIWGIDGALFAVGQRGQIFEHRSGRWRNSPGGALADQDFVSLWGTSADNIVLVGGRSNARIATYDGSRWTTRGESGLGGLNGVFMTSPDVAIVGGVEGFVGRYELADDRIVPETQDVTTIDVHAVWGDGDGTFYAVAGEFAPPFGGAALVRRLQ